MSEITAWVALDLFHPQKQWDEPPQAQQSPGGAAEGERVETEIPSSRSIAISCKQHLVLAAYAGAVSSLPCHGLILICSVSSAHGLTQKNQLTSQTNFWKHWLACRQDTQG